MMLLIPALVISTLGQLPTSADARPIPITMVVTDRSGRSVKDVDI